MPIGTPLSDLGMRASWYSQAPGWVDREDKPGSNVLGVPDAMQGIALPTRSTLGQWFDVTTPDGKTYRLQQTDIGPAQRTGRGVDISAAAASQMGYTPGTFPTDARFSVVPAEGGAPLTFAERYGGGQSGGTARASVPLADILAGFAPRSASAGSPFAMAPVHATPFPAMQPVQFAPLGQLGRLR